MDNLTSTLDKVLCSWHNRLETLYSRECDCPGVCKFTKYDTMKSSAPWPHASLHLDFVKKKLSDKPMIYKRFLPFLTKALAFPAENRSLLFEFLRSETIIKRNFLQINVELNPNTTITMKEVRLSTFSAILGSMGGILNLWMGVSFLTLIELIDFVITATKARLCTDSSNKKSEPPIHEESKGSANHPGLNLQISPDQRKC